MEGKGCSRVMGEINSVLNNPKEKEMHWITRLFERFRIIFTPLRLQRLNQEKINEEKRFIELIEKHNRLQIGKNSEVHDVEFGSNVNISMDVKLFRSSIGDYSYIGPRTSIHDAAIGKFCSIASDVAIGLGQHPSKKWVSTHPLFYLMRPEMGWSLSGKDYLDEFKRITIGNDVWIGLRVLIKDGVTIGDGAIIGAGAVVVSDVEPYAIYGGVPAKLIRYRFSEEQIRFLQNFQWWHRNEEWLKKNFKLMFDIGQLMDQYESAPKLNDGE